MNDRELTADDYTLIEAEAALRWAADGSFSARITPDMARVLLAKLEYANHPLYVTYTGDGQGGNDGARVTMSYKITHDNISGDEPTGSPV